MGMYDTFNVSDCDGQVKIFDRVMDTFNLGDIVDKSLGTYSIKLRYGKWVNIVIGVWVSYTEKPINEVLLDKWGRVYNEL
jgi:hypothetical protein